MDDFFLRMEQRTPERLREVGGNVDYERFEETVLRPLLQKEQVCYQPFSCQKWGLLKAYPIPYKRLNIIEGSYSMHPYFKNPYHVRIFHQDDDVFAHKYGIIALEAGKEATYHLEISLIE